MKNKQKYKNIDVGITYALTPNPSPGTIFYLFKEDVSPVEGNLGKQVVCNILKKNLHKIFDKNQLRKIRKSGMH